MSRCEALFAHYIFLFIVLPCAFLAQGFSILSNFRKFLPSIFLYGGKELWSFFISHQFRRICYPPAWSMRIYYPINDEEPTPALPKGGSLTPTPNPSPREGGKGQAPTRSGGYVIRLNKRSQVSGLTCFAFLSPLCFESEQARAQAVSVQADMLSACMEYEDLQSAII